MRNVKLAKHFTTDYWACLSRYTRDLMTLQTSNTDNYRIAVFQNTGNECL